MRKMGLRIKSELKKTFKYFEKDEDKAIRDYTGLLSSIDKILLHLIKIKDPEGFNYISDIRRRIVDIGEDELRHWGYFKDMLRKLK